MTEELLHTNLITKYSKAFEKLICYITYTQAITILNKQRMKYPEKDISIIDALNIWFAISDAALTRPSFRKGNISKEKYNLCSSYFVKAYGTDLQKVIKNYFKRIWDKQHNKRIYIRTAIINQVLSNGIIKKRSHIHINGVIALPNCYYPTREIGRKYILDNIAKIADLNSVFYTDFYNDFDRKIVKKAENLLNLKNNLMYLL